MSKVEFPAINVEGTGKLYARFVTTQGNMVAVLEEERVPRTVANFCGLATGAMEWKDPGTGEMMKGVPLYEKIRFHRVIPAFMVQCGDPLARDPQYSNRWGTGGPGYRFEDEFHSELKHNAPGILSMANSGPGTNGSQFFITEVPTPHLDRRHSVFGKVVLGVDVIAKLANVRRSPQDRPNEDQFIERIELFRSEVPPTA